MEHSLENITWSALENKTYKLKRSIIAWLYRPNRSSKAYLILTENCMNIYPRSSVSQMEDCKKCGLQCCDSVATALQRKRNFSKFLVTTSEIGWNDPVTTKLVCVRIKTYAFDDKSFWGSSFRNYQTEGIKASMN